jgi:cytochrome P450
MTKSTDVFEKPAIVEVSGFAEVQDAWKCPHLSAAIEGPGEHLFHAGTVMRLEGAQHLLRRRTMGLLLRRRGHQRFRDTWLFPTAATALAEVLAHPDPDGFVRTDLLRWARRVNQQLAAALVGFDAATTPAGADALFELVEVVMAGRPGAIQVTLGEFDEHAPAVQAALEARATLLERFYAEPMRRRRELAARHERGEIAEEDLPQDLLMLIAREADPDWADPALAEREALFLLVAGVHTTSSSLIWILRELFAWFDAHPEHRERVTDDVFLLGAVNEGLRLHPVVPGFARLATEDVELVEGTVVPKGAAAVIRSGQANLDRDVYGPDADTFDPDRAIPPGTYPHGFAFGTGPHMCYGMPIVMGAQGVDGSLVHLLRIVLAAGVQPDPDRPPEPIGPTRGVYADIRGHVAFPVVFPAEGAAR